MFTNETIVAPQETLAEWVQDAEQSNQHALALLRADRNSPPHEIVKEAQAEITKYKTNSDLQVLKKALKLQTTGTGILADAEIRRTQLATLQHLSKALFGLLKVVAKTKIKPCNMDGLMIKVESDAKALQADPRRLTKIVVKAAELVMEAIALQEKIREFLSQ
ncbi:unnamed protein product [Nippostrongylus brasiliensis]|uniref:Uncharacterized protein n=1 Tax=Nippostrongylus brasiliensis TaxID=27835 RepID=A0A0N4YY55_NIPBR|nr:unnamed protein product [Nippostrongylus brasiliensis]